MARKKTIKVEQKVVIPEVSKVEQEIGWSKYRLAHFEERRCNARTPEDLKLASFWVAHFKNKIANLQK